MTLEVPSICRVCHAQCPVLVRIEEGRAVSLTGIKDNPVYHGYACGKGRALPQYHYMPERLLHSQKRDASGRHAPIGADAAIRQIAERLNRIRARYGPRSIAIYNGTHGYNNFLSTAFAFAWMEALGSPMVFTSVTIDQPGKAVSAALHGTWLAGFPSMDMADSWLFVGANPVVSMLGPVNPAHALTRNLKRGMKLIVIDPRRTEVARRADVFLQPKPGHDPTLLAAMLNVIFERSLQDRDFINEHVAGTEDLRRIVAGFTPEFAQSRAGVPADDIVRAAELYAAGRRGVATVGTGPNMSGRGNLTEYLTRVLMSICGHWLQAGDQIPNPGVLVKRLPPLAQASPPSPAWGFGESLRVRNLTDTAAGMPTAALADEILMEGEGQVRALISIGGNPLMAWPDQFKTAKALDKLELLVSLDTMMSATARVSDYVLACKTHLEVDGLTALQESCGVFVGWGYGEPYGQYCSPAVEPPPESDVVEEWELFWGLARDMGLDLNVKPLSLAFYPQQQSNAAFVVDTKSKPTTSALYEALFADSPIPLYEIKKHPRGRVFDVPPVAVEPKTPGCDDRLDAANETMMEELTDVHATDPDEAHNDYPFRLTSRRLADIVNSSWRPHPVTLRRWPHNPAFMHPSDLEKLGVRSGDPVAIESSRAAITGIAEAAPDVRPGVVSMPHCWGDAPDVPAGPQDIGGNTGRLSANDSLYDPYTGIPRMSAIPVRVTPRAAADGASGVVRE